ncbi:hypothetical protein [Sediminispirochaeta bajacaliforniensis]|uniref:hypothetical protein n=1 Tax=Sediminispirochaeta bajacaliforniensis TaxID=148 RepID=UPI0009D9E41A
MNKEDILVYTYNDDSITILHSPLCYCVFLNHSYNFSPRSGTYVSAGITVCGFQVFSV